MSNKQFNLILPDAIMEDLDYLVKTHPGRTKSGMIRDIIKWYARRMRETQRGATLLLDDNGRYTKLEL